ncbi:DNA polymerase III, epsilon subunit [unidentified eubacterium SCB49]|nr:DNA polymerase III, epsilon subunit [unidentified eubacterium SCB49]
MDIKTEKFTVIDVETTGGVGQGRMTEICIITVENMEIVDVWSSLINPEIYIPQHITALTGITDQMVTDAPRFCDVAAIIEEKTRDAIFVAHNVNFDYGFLKKEFDLIGASFSRKKLCTVRLSRKLIPGLPSYSLSKLCRSIGISLLDAHRAEADTRATTTLFLQLLEKDSVANFEVFLNFLNKSSREATLPPHINTEDFNRLPSTAGIYLFKDKKGKILYVGKAKNIKKRVLSHLYSKTQKSINMCAETHHLDFVETGNELSALLLESDYIQQFYPKFNKAQKRPVKTFQIISYTNRIGVEQIALGECRSATNSVYTLYNKIAGLALLTRLCETYNLCPKYCALQTTNEPCSHYKITDCYGVCSGNEPAVAYNKRVSKALEALENLKDSFVIKQPGRTSNENAIILIENGEYQGFGFIDKTESVSDFNDFRNYITRYKNSYHTSKAIHAFLNKENAEKSIIRLEVDKNVIQL